MSNYKQLIRVIACLSISFTGCLTPSYNFDHASIFTDEFKNDLSLKLGGALRDSIVSSRVFKATFQEVVIVRNSVGESTLVNTLSKRVPIRQQSSGPYSELYFFEFQSIHRQWYGGLLAATFNPMGGCIRAGPMYLGFIGLGEKGTKKFIVEKEYTVRLRPTSSIASLKLVANSPKLIFSYSIIQDSQQEKVSAIKFFQILQRGGNKISGTDKLLVYDPAVVFDDEDALLFSLLNEK